MQYSKVKSVSKSVISNPKVLNQVISDTLSRIAEIVGATLGPGGKNVLIERQEQGMQPMVTKDGVTVFKNLGFEDSTAQVIMEATREAAARTASEAGDGTSNCSVLANAFYKATSAFCAKNPKVSPQRVVRAIENAFKTIIEPYINSTSIKTNLETGRETLKSVAKVSANGDSQLAEAVMECFDLIGDEGNVTILECIGPSKYEVEKIDGYAMPTGFEDHCGAFYQKFINDTGTQSCQLEKPVVILYYGQIREISVCATLFERIIDASNGKVPNIVLCATGFSETVLGHLAVNFSAPNKNINVYPFLIPLSPMKTGQYDFLADLAALSRGKIFDPIQKPLDNGQVFDLGEIEQFESTRFRSNFFISMNDLVEKSIYDRVDELNNQLGTVATSELDRQLLKERIGKLTGGIAKLLIYGSTTGELREKRDRAEDAVCAVRGAIKHGVLPGGGWTLVMLSGLIKALGYADNQIYYDVVGPALMEPVYLLFENAGYQFDEYNDIIKTYTNVNGVYKTYDLLEGKEVVALDAGLLDSTPAVLEAIRNSISIATQLGTCGGTIVYKRDGELERKEGKEVSDFLKDLNSDDKKEEPITERP